MVATLSGISAFLLLLVVGKLGQRFPTLSVAGYAVRILGRWPGKAVALALSLNFALNASVDLSVAMKNLEGVFFIRTPPLVIGVILALMALSAVWFGLVTAARMAPALLTLLFLTFLLTFPALWRWIKPGYLIPVFDPSPIDWGSRPFLVSLGVIRAALFPVVFMPYIQEPKRALRTLGWAHWVGWALNMLAVLAPILVFSPEGARALAQPFPFVIGVLRLPSFPLERVEMIARLAFHINSIYAVSNIYFTSALLMGEVFGTRTIRPFLLVAVVISLLPQYLIPTSAYGDEFAYGSVIRGMVMAWTVFPLLWLVYWIRGLGKKQQASA